MKVIIADTGEKRYRFEDGDLLAKRKFEEGIISGNSEELSKIIELLISKANQRSLEAWNNLKHYILEIDPQAEVNEMSYDYFLGEVRNSIPKDK